MALAAAIALPQPAAAQVTETYTETIEHYSVGGGSAGTTIRPSDPIIGQSTVEIIAPTAPPPSRVEEIPPPPASTGVAWQAGHWSWSGDTWLWNPGRYVPTEPSYTAWEPGRWVQQPQGWVWVEGHWR